MNSSRLPRARGFPIRFIRVLRLDRSRAVGRGNHTSERIRQELSRGRTLSPREPAVHTCARDGCSGGVCRIEFAYDVRAVVLVTRRCAIDGFRESASKRIVFETCRCTPADGFESVPGVPRVRSRAVAFRRAQASRDRQRLGQRDQRIQSWAECENSTALLSSFLKFAIAPTVRYLLF